MIVAIEGVDGAGKHTLTGRLAADLRRHGRSVATAAFPRYATPPLGPVVRRMLAGDPAFAAAAASPQTAALLFALDRAGAAADLGRLARDHDVLLVDRYVASNAAYGAARAEPSRQQELVEWVAAVEVADLGVPAPDLQVLVRVPVATAAARAAERGDRDGSRGTDVFERDRALQERSAWWYDRLAAANWLSEWIVFDDTSDAGAYGRLLARLLARQN